MTRRLFRSRYSSRPAMALSCLLLLGSCASPLPPEERAAIQRIVDQSTVSLDNIDSKMKEVSEYLEQETPQTIEGLETELKIALDRLSNIYETRIGLSRAFDTCISTVPNEDLIDLLTTLKVTLAQWDQVQGYVVDIHSVLSNNKRELDEFEVNELVRFAKTQDETRLEEGQELYANLVRLSYIQPQGEIVLKDTVLFANFYEGMQPLVEIYPELCELLVDASPELERRTRRAAEKFRAAAAESLEQISRSVDAVAALSTRVEIQATSVKACLTTFNESQGSFCEFENMALELRGL